ncbi:hypothetical protein Psch_01328 [Pelotomaculum schinkii]|uniref:DUF4236 domain-containing protein n=1 Tax=Pelotomaculum schinkii TaxID=78350 RepID=A0A4Y7RG64_9FIRM|nr:DUF4236 domain-containing protein [Pelotomaculum schinkii]TEB07773.1 hypothetical protein Psch_01328 [Pelotomaculum schinkii]
MGFRMRKSINLGGGFKINLSKSGIGYSWGVPGYRITKTAKGATRRTYSIPGTGISYVDETGHNSHNHANNNGTRTRTNQYADPSGYIQTPGYDQVRNIEIADIEQLKTAEADNITATIEKTMRFNKWGTILLWCGLLGFAQWYFFVLPIIGIVLKVVAHKTGVVDLDYSFDDEKADEYNRRIGAWLVLSEGDREWQVIQEASVSNTKVNAGAGRNIKRVVCRIEKGTPYYIRTNVETIQLKLQKELLLFLPDKVFIIRKKKVGAVNYSDVVIRTSQVKFVETGRVPKDAQVVDSTWQYVNKNGTPDRRYSNNRQLPICLYGIVTITSPNGINVEMQFSNIQKTQDFEALAR